MSDDIRPPVEQQARPRARRQALPWVTVGLALLVLAADQGTKAWALHSLGDGRRVDVVGSLFGFELVRNAGAAFSMATGMTWLLTLVALIVVIAIIRISRRLGSAGWALAFGLLLGGALGNLTDRLTREPGFFRGHVIDFLVLPHWPVFNVADSCIVTAAVLIALLSVIGIGIDGQRVGKPEEAAGGPRAQAEPAPDVPNAGVKDRDG
jgi:signal peptidase II